MKLSRTASIAALALGLAAPGACAEDPYADADESWISVSGTVAQSSPDSFLLDYGDGVITVEMDGWDSWDDAYNMIEGDNVTVYGVVDDDFLELATVEAGAVYVEGLNTFFHANPADEEDALNSANYYYSPINVGDVTIRGTVTDVRPEEDEFTLDSGFAEIDVETENLPYEPFEGGAFREVAVGDRVSVTGRLDKDWFEDPELMADYIITLRDDTP